VSAPFRLAEDAVRDLEEAAAYLSEESETAALHLADDLEHAFLFIARWPACGYPRPDLTPNEDIRFWSSNGYLIVYRARPRPLLILGVLHGGRDAASAIAPRLLASRLLAF
jgi:plasmid stabilization system protein ParE